jgi:hypothetical protein
MPIISQVNRTVDSNGKVTLSCFMKDDGSTWTCDQNEENWEKIELGLEELQQKLNNYLATK